MDEKTLNSLQIAFQASPSAELAKILLLSHIQNNKLSEALAYIDSVEDNLSPEEACDTALVLANANESKALVNLALKLGSEKVKALLDTLIESSLLIMAKNVYSQCLDEGRLTRMGHIDALLDMKPERVKLKVVEKIDFSEVTNLSNYREESTNFNDVVGLTNIKKQIHKKIILPFQKPSLFQKFKKKVGGGVLLYGPPGCGKTLLARATAGECNASFFNIEISDVMDMYIGESEQKLHAIFEKARSEAPSVIFFDELEALAGKREHARNNATSNTISQFLTELDGFAQNNHGVLVLASTNVPWAIDNAFLRPGRFDRMFFVAPPDQVARQAILEHHMNDRPSNEDIDFTAIANKTPGYSGADLANLVDMAADEAIEETIETENEVSIALKHFKLALSESTATTKEWLTTARNYARYANDGGRYNDVLDFIKKYGK